MDEEQVKQTGESPLTLIMVMDMAKQMKKMMEVLEQIQLRIYTIETRLMGYGSQPAPGQQLTDSGSICVWTSGTTLGDDAYRNARIDSSGTLVLGR